MAKPKLFVVGSDWGYSRPWKPLFDLTRDFSRADVMLLTGGSDVSPEFYGEEFGKYTRSVPRRDMIERIYFRDAVKRKIGILGICRGAQFITVMNGGKLVQHVTNHGQWHEIATSKGDKFEVSSTHHQMMHPYDLNNKDYQLLGWAHQHSNCYLDGDDKQIPYFWKPDTEEPEVVFYPRTRALAIQCHPEIMPLYSDGVKQFHKWTKEFIL